jgi:Tol biopolymer transport system component
LSGVAWLGTDRLIYSQAEPEPHASEFNLWVLRLEATTRAAAGKPRQRTHWVNFSISDLASSADGRRVCFLNGESQGDVYILRLRRQGGAEKPRRLTLDDSDDRPTAWTPDSRAVLFSSTRNNNQHDIFKQEIDKESADLLVGEPGSQNGPRLSPDGNWILYLAYSAVGDRERAKYSINKIPVRGGSSEPLLTSDRYMNIHCSAVAGGPCIVDEQEGKKQIVTLLDPIKGRGKEVARVLAEIGAVDISPDGSRIAFVLMSEPRNRICVLALDGKLEREITVDSAQSLNQLDWAIDGRGFFCGATTGGNSSTLLHIDLDGTARVLWTQPGIHYMWGIPSRDGKFVAAFGATHTGNVWTAENF